jgi:hypothetical protein
MEESGDDDMIVISVSLEEAKKMTAKEVFDRAMETGQYEVRKCDLTCTVTAQDAKTMTAAQVMEREEVKKKKKKGAEPKKREKDLGIYVTPAQVMEREEAKKKKKGAEPKKREKDPEIFVTRRVSDEDVEVATLEQVLRRAGEASKTERAASDDA